MGFAFCVLVVVGVLCVNSRWMIEMKRMMKIKRMKRRNLTMKTINMRGFNFLIKKMNFFYFNLVIN